MLEILVAEKVVLELILVLENEEVGRGHPVIVAILEIPVVDSYAIQNYFCQIVLFY